MRNPVEKTLVYHYETPLALLISEDGDRDNGTWLPKSQIQYDETFTKDGDPVVITMPEWLAIDKGLD
jgi:hypothetical protein